MIDIHHQDDVRVLTLAFGKANPLDANSLRAIAAAFDPHTAELPRGYVLTAKGSIFSAGLDLLALVDADRATIADVVDALDDALRAIFVCPRPVVAALNGFAVAGGALLALAADRRLIAEGNARIGLTEIRLGLPMPALALEMLRYPLERAALETMLYDGALLTGAQAQALGAVDAIVPADALVARAVECAHEWTPSVSAFADIKARLRAPTLERMDAARAATSRFVDLWFGDEVRARIVAAVEQMRSRRS